MQIYVCVKHVPDSAAHVTILEKKRIDEAITFLLNPYDEHAVTEAVRIKKKQPDSEIIAVCLGKSDAEKTLRSAMAMGADRGILIESESYHDSIETARLLKSAIEIDGEPGLIFTGKESIDAEGMQTMFRLGALFDFPVATNVVSFTIDAGKATVNCEISGGTVNTYKMDLPCVIGAGRGLNTPGYPTFPDVVKSKKKPIKQIPLIDLDIKKPTSAMTIVELVPLNQTREPKELKGGPSDIAKKIVTILKDEAKVLS